MSVHCLESTIVCPTNPNSNAAFWEDMRQGYHAGRYAVYELAVESRDDVNVVWSM